MMKPNDDLSYSSLIVIYITVVLFWLLHFLPHLTNTFWWYGFHHLGFLPLTYTYVFAACGLIGLIALFTPLGNLINSGLECIGNIAFSEDKKIRWLILALISLPVFYFLRLDFNLLGDGYTIVNNIGDQYPVLYKWTEKGAVALAYGIFKILPWEGLEGAQRAEALISIFSGGVVVYFMAAAAFEMAEKTIQRIFIFLLVVTSGWMLLFFGYVENYPPLWAVLAAYIYFGLRYINGKSGFIAATILGLAAVVLHLQSIFYLLSWPILLISHGTPRRIYKQHRKLVLIGTVVLAIAAIAAFLHRYFVRPDFAVHFLPLITGRPKTPDYAVISISHFRDILNLMILVIPVGLALILVAIKEGKPKKRDDIERFLAAFSLGGLLLLLSLDPRLGMGRDWDLFSLTLLGPFIIVVRRAGRVITANPRLVSGLILFSLVLAFPFWAVCENDDAAIEHYKTLLEHRQSQAKPGMIVLRDFYNRNGKKELADSLNALIIERFPLTNLARGVESMVKAGKFGEAKHLADSILKAEPFSADSYNMMGMVYFYGQQFDSAIKYFDQSRLFRPNDPNTLGNLGYSLVKLGRVDEAMPLLERGQFYRPDDPFFPLIISRAYLVRQMYDSALFFAEKSIRIDTSNAQAFLTAGSASFNLGLKNKARVYLSRYYDLDSAGAVKMHVPEILERLK